MLADLLKLQLDLLGARTELAISMLGGGLLSRVAPVSDRPQPVITIPGFRSVPDPHEPVSRASRI